MNHKDKHEQFANRFYVGDVIGQLKRLPDNFVQTVATSPPYWNLRDYGTAKWEGGDPACDHGQQLGGEGETSTKQNTSTGTQTIQYRDVCGKCDAIRVDDQLGLESTPDEYVAKMVAIFREIRRVLRDDGTVWLNMGDSYAASGMGGNPSESAHRKQATNAGSLISGHRPPPGLKPKDLCGIPWRVAFALQADGWYLRQDIVYAKRNPMPESIKDRCTKSHEYVFLLSKSVRYYYDAAAIAEQSQVSDRWHEPDAKYLSQSCGDGQTSRRKGFHRVGNVGGTRNKRDVWTVTTKGYKDAHFATFSEALIEPCILAGTSEHGCCPECGNPWVREDVVVGKTVTDSMRYAGCDENGVYAGNATKDFESANAQDASETKKRVLESMSKVKEYRWVPGCKCVNRDVIQAWDDVDATKDAQPYEPIPCVVMDPFVGSGTTTWVANHYGRSWIGVDLSEDYIETLAKPRMKKPYPEKKRSIHPDFAWLERIKGLGPKSIIRVEDQYDGDIIKAMGDVENWNISEKICERVVSMMRTPAHKQDDQH